MTVTCDMYSNEFVNRCSIDESILYAGDNLLVCVGTSSEELTDLSILDTLVYWNGTIVKKISRPFESIIHEQDQ